MTSTLAAAQILVTGATGFVGRHLIARLLAAGVAPQRLRCLVRNLDDAVRGGLPPASVRRADLTDSLSWQDLADGVDVVFHLAGAVKAWRADGFQAVNITAAARLADLVAARAPRARFVLVSSLAAAGPSPDGVGSDAPPDRCRPVSRYGESKRQGELAVRARLAGHVTVRPPAIYGPGDAATRLLFRQALAPLAAVPWRPTPLSIAHVDDVVGVLLAAATADVVGRVLPIDGPDRTDTHSLLRQFAAACDRTARLVRVPAPIANAAAGAADLWARLAHRASFFSRDKLREVHAAGWIADGSAAAALAPPRIALAAGLRQVAVQEGFARAATSATA